MLVPRSSVPVSVTVAPRMPESGPFWIPSRLKSWKTTPLIEAGWSSPKLYPVATVFAFSITTPLITSLGGLFTVTPPAVPTVFFPSSKPPGCVSVIV